jgi:hypothetical protein
MMYLFAWHTARSEGSAAARADRSAGGREQNALTAAMEQQRLPQAGRRTDALDAARAVEIERLLEAAFERWAELDQRGSVHR